MKFPWTKPDLEIREAVTPSGDYSRDLVALLLSQAGGTTLRGVPAALGDSRRYVGKGLGNRPGVIRTNSADRRP